MLAVLDGVLAQRKFAGGSDVSIADIVHFGRLWRRDVAGIDFEAGPTIARRYEGMSARPAVVCALERLTALVPPA